MSQVRTTRELWSHNKTYKVPYFTLFATKSFLIISILLLISGKFEGIKNKDWPRSVTNDLIFCNAYKIFPTKPLFSAIWMVSYRLLNNILEWFNVDGSQLARLTKLTTYLTTVNAFLYEGCNIFDVDTPHGSITNSASWSWLSDMLIDKFDSNRGLYKQIISPKRNAPEFDELSFTCWK